MSNLIKLKIKQADGSFTEYRVYSTVDEVFSSDGTKTLTQILTGYSTTDHTHNYAGSSSAGGSANSADKLATSRTINGTSFDGTTDITTTNWGTARNLTIGNKTQSVDGSGNVSWSLSDMGAMPLPSLVTQTISNNTLTLSSDRYQYVDSMTNNVIINLPSVSDFTEIHLFFLANADLTLILPNALYQKLPEITSGCMYEFIFTYVGNHWLGGFIEYSDIG